ncbi:MAG: L-rhamnose/proton symporter RhaT [Capsulimonadaceae bacterium]|nr:L-rhamnose/proton symporter RhaT [Capsulimonadaceae bacterium]
MAANPLLGLIFHWIGGLAAASFYIPYRFVKRWSWETYWLAGGVFSWIVAPSLFALLLVPGALHAILSAPIQSIGLAYLFGAMWGLGGLTFGLTMRYLGIALGMAVALGYCAAFGTVMPPLVHGTLAPLFQTTSGHCIIGGVVICLVGIGVSGLAGMSKEHELSAEEKQAVTTEFDFGKGMMVATFSGIMSSCFAYGLDAGKPIADLAKQSLVAANINLPIQNLPVLIVVLLGGFTTNFIWCVILNIRNKSAREYVGGVAPAHIDASTEPVSLPRNYLFCAIAGVTWYLQFFFYSMGQVKMGSYSYSSWTLHMASIIIFSTLWGIALHEWKGTSKRTHLSIALGLAILIGSTVVIGYGNYLAIPHP